MSWWWQDERQERIERQLGYILSEVSTLIHEVRKMSKQLDDLKAAVAANTAATQAAVTKIGTLEDPAALQPLTDAVNASATALNAAIAPPAPAI